MDRFVAEPVALSQSSPSNYHFLIKHCPRLREVTLPMNLSEIRCEEHPGDLHGRTSVVKLKLNPIMLPVDPSSSGGAEDGMADTWADGVWKDLIRITAGYIATCCPAIGRLKVNHGGEDIEGRTGIRARRELSRQFQTYREPGYGRPAEC